MVRTKPCFVSKIIGLLAGAFFLLAMPSHAADAWTIDDIAVLTDPSGIETIDSVNQASRSAELKPFPHGFSAGFTRSVHWIRFALNAPPENEQGIREVLLEIHPS